MRPSLGQKSVSATLLKAQIAFQIGQQRLIVLVNRSRGYARNQCDNAFNIAHADRLLALTFGLESLGSAGFVNNVDSLVGLMAISDVTVG